MLGPPINSAYGIPDAPAITAWLAILGIAIVIDLLVGERVAFLSKRLNSLIRNPAKFFETRLNRKDRNHRDLKIRGFIVTIITVSLSAFLGFLFNATVVSIPGGGLIAAILLIPFIGQKAIWAHMGTPIEVAPSKADSHMHVQERAIAVIRQFGTYFLPSSLLFICGGFYLLLPFLMLGAVVYDPDTQAPKNGPYYSAGSFFFTALSLPGTLLAVLSLLLARFFMPGTHLNPLKGMGPNRSKLAASFYWPVNIVARGLYLSFKHPVLCYKKHALKREAVWIGPSDGTARLTALHLKRVWYMVLAANIFCLLSGVMLYTALTVTAL